MGKHGESAEVRPVSNHTLQAEFTTTLPVYPPINGEEREEISISTPICSFVFCVLLISILPGGYVTLLVTVPVGADGNLTASPFYFSSFGKYKIL